MTKCTHCKKHTICENELRFQRENEECKEFESNLEYEIPKRAIWNSFELEEKKDEKEKREIITYCIAKKLINIIDEVLEELYK